MYSAVSSPGGSPGYYGQQWNTNTSLVSLSDGEKQRLCENRERKGKRGWKYGDV